MQLQILILTISLASFVTGFFCEALVSHGSGLTPVTPVEACALLSVDCRDRAR